MKQMPVLSFLLGGGQSGFFCDPAHFRSSAIRRSETSLGQLLLAELVQEIALILVAVRAAQQAVAAVVLLDTRVMSGRRSVGAEFEGVVQEIAELDLAVAQDVRIRRAAFAVFIQEICEDFLRYSCLEIDCIEGIPICAQTRRDIFSILHLRCSGRIRRYHPSSS